MARCIIWLTLSCICLFTGACNNGLESRSLFAPAVAAKPPAIAVAVALKPMDSQLFMDDPDWGPVDLGPAANQQAEALRDGTFEPPVSGAEADMVLTPLVLTQCMRGPQVTDYTAQYILTCGWSTGTGRILRFETARAWSVPHGQSAQVAWNSVASAAFAELRADMLQRRQEFVPATGSNRRYFADIDFLLRTATMQDFEGLWTVTSDQPYKLLLIRDEEDHGSYTGYVVNSPIRQFHKGMRKMTLQQMQGNLYKLTWWDADHLPNETISGLAPANRFVISLPRKESSKTLTFVRNDGAAPVAGAKVGSGTGDQETGGLSMGSGFLLATQPPVIVTNYHVVTNMRYRNIRLGNEIIPIHMVAKDPNVDLAILSCDAGRLPKGGISIRPSTAVDIGEQVYTLGFPLPDILSDDMKYTDGAISAKSGPENDASLLQVSVPIQPGNSGGGLFTTKGQCVGIIVAELDALTMVKRQRIVPQNTNFAIKSEYLENLLKVANVAIPQGATHEHTLKEVQSYVVQVFASAKPLDNYYTLDK